MYERLIETLNAVIYFEIFCCDKFYFNVAIFSSDLKNFLKILWVIVNANSNIFIIFVFVLIKKILKENEDFFINFARKIINMWAFNLVVQSNANITNVVVFVKKRFYDVSINKIYFLIIKNDIIIIILKSFDITNARYTNVL